MTAAAVPPEPKGWSTMNPDGLEPAPQWAGDSIAAERFSSPEAIRAALLPEQLAEFDAAYDAALTTARQTLHLDELRRMLRVWRRIALLTQQDPDQHRQAFATAAEIRRTGRPRPGSVSWTDLKTDLGL